MSVFQDPFDPRIRPGLDRIQALLKRLGHPERAFPVVHVAGTNGKGSTSAMVAQALRAAGHRVGMTVSPDLGRSQERIHIDGAIISESEWQAALNLVEAGAAGMADPPTFFEAMVAVSFVAFQRLEVDVAVVEVGLGGRLDATNVVPCPLLSVITPIHFDHMAWLGTTIAQIAGEKAGILKAGTRLVVAIQEFSEALAVITQRARLLGIPWSQPTGRYGSDRESPYYQDPEGRLIRTNLLGHYQAINLATAWTAILELHRMGWIVDLDQAAQSLKDIRWPGRFEPIQRRPLVVIDGAHNLQAAQALAVTLGSSPWSTYRWHLLFATLADKPGNDMIAALAPLMHSLTITEVSGHRRQTAAELKAPVDPRYPVSVVPDPARAYAEALDKVQQNPAEAALLVTGSLAFLAELRLRHILPEDGGIFH